MKLLSKLSDYEYLSKKVKEIAGIELKNYKHTYNKKISYEHFEILYKEIIAKAEPLSEEENK